MRQADAAKVLDEATSALDTETEREIQRALSDLVSSLLTSEFQVEEIRRQRVEAAFLSHIGYQPSSIPTKSLS
jgi:ABC-type polar amino acid transport system ATPase subunit